MPAGNLRTLIDRNKQYIILGELIGILHDIGKLSKVFLEYRKTWRTLPEGWTSDPHDHNFLAEHDPIITKSDYKQLLEWFNDTHLQNISVPTDNLTPASAVNNHTNPDNNDILRKTLKIADSIDAALDRNNPLFAGEQKEEIFASNIYGLETGPINIDEQDILREELYKELCGIELPIPGKKDIDFDKRKAYLNIIKKYFDQGLADTTRPDNDTTLWEHCYAVGSLFKVFLLHGLIYGEDITEFKEGRFAIFGVGWNAFRFISAGHKIADIIGRRECITQYKAAITELVEFDYCLGNCIYEDDNGIYFLIPANETNEEYNELLKELKEAILAKGIEITLGDLTPSFSLISNTTKVVTRI
jgi:hypothetical protein